MANRAVYQVIPGHDGWVVRLAGDSLTEIADTKELAVERAKELARRATLGTVLVLARDGRVEQEFTYGKEPSPPG